MVFNSTSNNVHHNEKEDILDQNIMEAVELILFFYSKMILHFKWGIFTLHWTFLVLMTWLHKNKAIIACAPERKIYNKSL